MKIVKLLIMQVWFFLPAIVFSQIKAVDGTVDLGIVEMGVSTTREIVIENVGTVPVVIGQPRLLRSDNEFYSLSNSNTCTTLFPKEKCQIGITYSPQIPGEFRATVRVPVATPGFNNIGVTVTGRCAGVVDLVNDTLDAVHIWQKNTLAFILRASGASSYDYQIHADYDVQIINLNTQSGVFIYTPDSTQRRPFSITFMAKDDAGSIIAEQILEVDPIPGVNPELVPVGIVNQTPVPDSISRDYTFISNLADENTTDTLNGVPAKLRTVTIAGKTLLFSRRNSEVSLNLSELLRADGESTKTAPLDLKELNLIGETIIISDSLVFKNTNVNIIARELIFQDDNKGPKACINIEPEPLSQNAPVDSNGIRGLDCNVINVKINGFRSFAVDGSQRNTIRFYAKGGDGQSVTSSGKTPGSGGNGGTLIVNNFNSSANLIEQYYYAPGGLSGFTKDSVRTGGTGTFGKFIVRDDGQYDWVNPTWIRLAMIHLRDAYLLEKLPYVQEIASEYTMMLDDAINSGTEFNALETQDQADLRALSSEVLELLLRVEQGLDYYGNPLGWFPALSFEYNLTAYNQEVNYAVPALAYVYQIQNRFNVLSNDTRKIEILLDTLGNRQKQLTMKYNQLNNDLDAAKIEIKEIENQTNILYQRIEQRTNELIQQAKNNTKKKGLRKIAQVAGALCQVAAAVTGIRQLRQVGNALEAVSNMEFSGNLIKNAQKAYAEYKNAEKVWEENGANLRNQLPPEIKKALENPEGADKYPQIGAAAGIPIKNSDVIKYMNENLENLANLKSSLTKLSSAIRGNSAPAHIVAAEIARLKATDPVYNSLLSQVEKLSKRRGLLLEKIEGIISNLTFIINELPRLYLTASALTKEYQEETYALDPRIGPFFKDMEKNIRDRILKYNYYMRKAYEYRFLKPYPYTSNPLPIFDRVRKLVDTNTTGEIPPTMVDGMKTIFKEDLRNIALSISSNYNDNRPKREPAPQSFQFSKDEIIAINRGDTVVANPYNRTPQIRWSNYAANEDLRITKLEYEFSILPIDQTGTDPKVKLTAEYPDKSILSKNGVDYVFVTKANDPITWEGTKRGDRDIEYTRTAESDLSLLSSLLDKVEDIQKFALPAVNADIRFFAPLSDRTNAIIDTTKPMQVHVFYEYSPQSNGARSVYISTNSEEIAPKFLLSQNSIDPARRDGHGEISRSFKNDEITIEAVQKYGVWMFDHWERTDSTTRIDEPRNHSIALNMNEIHGVKAVYHGPVAAVRIGLSDLYKDSLRTAGRAVLGINESVQVAAITDSVKLVAHATFLDGRLLNVTPTSSFSIHPDDASKAKIEDDDVVRLLINAQAKDSVRVIARFVDNDIEVLDTATLIIDKITSVDEDQGVHSIRATVFPNPTDQDVTLVYSQPNPGSVKIEVVDNSGRLVFFTTMPASEVENRITIPTSNLPSGTYYVKISTETGDSSIPFVVHH